MTVVMNRSAKTVNELIQDTREDKARKWDGVIKLVAFIFGYRI